VEKFQQNKDNDHLVDCLFLVGNCYYELGEWANAEKFMTMCSELGNRYFPDEMGSAPLKIIAESQYQQQKFDDALKTFQARVQKIQKQGSNADQGELAGALFDVAGLMINMDRAAEAFPLLQQAETANSVAATALNKAGSTATQADKDANIQDRAEIVYHQGIALFRQDKFAECRPKLESALSLFDGVQNGGRSDVKDRLVAVLDDLVVVCDKLNDKAASDKFKARRDALNQ
jgi:tetratricopeptide (TPR) repeat protein